MHIWYLPTKNKKIDGGQRQEHEHGEQSYCLQLLTLSLI